MNVWKVAASLLTPLILVFALNGCAPTAKSEGTGGYIDDTVITAKVKSELVRDDRLKAREINVETFKGRVQLSGFVGSATDASLAVQAARGVAGVKSVENDMQIK
ncbi:BON domain-containing protein [Candidatus Sodalis endolongispinus]|uniref:BON domain-containing protein n=1 Tax=Candidatus Sodalis endolongispinus TaxID=2812662 RepID=A0ABS5YE94_9GAMM|nr:BON domain-containing protein [Candidatus Sodalis endolongispinus]MBT9433249.1 BON domain-containing protein [Candidatus Sodalis endolongispinus]